MKTMVTQTFDTVMEIIDNLSDLYLFTVVYHISWTKDKDLLDQEHPVQRDYKVACIVIFMAMISNYLI